MDGFEIQFDAFKWVDLVNPKREVLEQIAKELNLPVKVVTNCLDPDYLPHIETYSETQFILLRMMEPEFKLTADTVQELTTKIAVFVGPKKVYTIHRMPLVEIKNVRERMDSFPKSEVRRTYLLTYLFEQVSLGFDNPLNKLEYKVEHFEERMFQGTNTKNLLLEGYYIKRQSSAFRKVMKLSIDAYGKLISRTENPIPKMQEVKDRMDRNLFYAEDVFDNVQSLLNLHMSIESQRTNEGSFRTNEIMRVLTVITIFFLPLNFLAGVFGMNFKYIPLLENPYGFWISIILMLVISVILSMYVMRKGWIEKPPSTEKMGSNN